MGKGYRFFETFAVGLALACVVLASQPACAQTLSCGDVTLKEGASGDITCTLDNNPGAAVGTLAYMSPEQARAEDLDPRTDLFSFGAVLYEMATGQPAFSGNSTAVIFEAILNRAPLGTYGVREIWLMGAHGESPHRILAAGEQARVGGIQWSPVGGRIGYRYAHRDGDKTDVSVESCDLNGANKTTILSDDQVNGSSWISPGRLVYSRGNSSAPTVNLWELKVDSKNGIPQDKPRRLTDWSGFFIYGLSATADGKRLAFLRGTAHNSVFVGDLTNNGIHLLNPHRLTMDEYFNTPLSWTAESREVIFYSNQGGNGGIYKQALDANTGQVITALPDLDIGKGG